VPRVPQGAGIGKRAKEPAADSDGDLFTEGGGVNQTGNANDGFAGLLLKPWMQTAARLLPGFTVRAPNTTTEDADLQRKRRDGATGLEPATSGVTGWQAGVHAGARS
jgi:hypothetical protein